MTPNPVWLDFRHRVTVEHTSVLRSFGLQLLVFVDGEDVTEDCVVAEASHGYVMLLARNDAGQRFLDKDTRMPAKYSREGKITFALAWVDDYAAP